MTRKNKARLKRAEQFGYAGCGIGLIGLLTGIWSLLTGKASDQAIVDEINKLHPHN